MTKITLKKMDILRVADDFIGVHLAVLSSRVINVDDDNRSQMNGVQRNLMAP